MYGLRRGMGATATVVPDPGPATSWWCPVPGTTVSYIQQLFGCPVDSLGLAPAGPQPSDSLVNQIVYSGQVPPSPTAPNPAAGAGTSTVPAPYDCVPGDISNPNCPGYAAALAASSAAQKAAQANALNQAAANYSASIQTGCPGQTLVQSSDGTLSCPSLVPGIPDWAWIALAGFGVFAVVAAGAGSPRRYRR